MESKDELDLLLEWFSGRALDSLFPEGSCLTDAMNAVRQEARDAGLISDDRFDEAYLERVFDLLMEDETEPLWGDHVEE